MFETTPSGLFPKYKLSLNSTGHRLNRWLNGHIAHGLDSLFSFQKYYFNSGPCRVTHMSGICMGEIGLKWITHDSFCLGLDSCNRRSSYWTNMIRLRTERVFKAFPMWNLWRKPKKRKKKILKGGFSVKHIELHSNHIMSIHFPLTRLDFFFFWP